MVSCMGDFTSSRSDLLKGLVAVEASANRNEKMLVEQLLGDVLGEDFEVELVAGDSQFESERVFSMLEEKKIDHFIAWRGLRED
jgi:hypothetical protein